MLGGAPLGQPGDVGPRLRSVMATADVLAVEDTRRLHRLASDLGVTFTGRDSETPFGIWGEFARQLGKQSEFEAYYSPLRAPGPSSWAKR